MEPEDASESDVSSDHEAEVVQDNEQDVSALRENIKKKGSNSYYYAHGQKINGPAWDGKEEPRLLFKTKSQDGEVKETIQPAIITVSFESYAWADEKKSVKIYIDFEDAASIDDNEISLTNSINSFELRVKKGNKVYALVVDNLNSNIDSVSIKKKSDKIVLSLKKVVEASWDKLKKEK